jgi:hypothetical protein
MRTITKSKFCDCVLNLTHFKFIAYLVAFKQGGWIRMGTVLPKEPIGFTCPYCQSTNWINAGAKN